MTTSPPPPPPAAALTAVGYTIPSTYSNLVGFTYINGVFRVTFYEQHLAADPSTGALRETLHARTSVTLTPATFAEALRTGGELYNTVATAATAATQAAAFAPSGGGSLQ